MAVRHGAQKVLEACGCCCEADTMLVRRYKTAKEEMEKLENYREELKKELAGIEERIRELKSQ